MDLGGGAQSPSLSNKGLTSFTERQVFGLLLHGYCLLMPPFLSRHDDPHVHHGFAP
jgi:hypothetical protein